MPNEGVPLLGVTAMASAPAFYVDVLAFEISPEKRPGGAHRLDFKSPAAELEETKLSGREGTSQSPSTSEVASTSWAKAASSRRA